jgi:hypothetical protein
LGNGHIEDVCVWARRTRKRETPKRRRGGRINVRIGTRTSDEHKQVHGPYGIARSNSRGKNLVHILGSKDQRVEKAFSNYTYVTYTSIHTTFTPTAFQSCTTSSCAHNPFTSKHMTAKQFLTVGAVLIKN